MMGAHVTGIDASERNIAIATDHARASGLFNTGSFVQFIAAVVEAGVIFEVSTGDGNNVEREGGNEAKHLRYLHSTAAELLRFGRATPPR